MKSILLLASLLTFLPQMRAQQTVGWSATSGDVSLSGAATAVTVQAPATNPSTTYIDSVVVYCSVACSVTQSVNGAAATTTAGSFKVLSPGPINFTVPLSFFTASNLGAGAVAQGGITHVPAGGTVVLCFTQSCGNPQQFQMTKGSGTADNFTVSVASITGTANITIFGRVVN